MRILKGTGDTPEGGLGHHPNRRLGASAKKKQNKQKNYGYLAVLLRTDLSKYLPNLDIGKRLLKFGNNVRNHTHKVNV